MRKANPAAVVPLHPITAAIAALCAGSTVAAVPMPANNQHDLIKVDEIRATIVPPYEQVKPVLRQFLEQQALERATAQLVAGLIKSAKIQQ